MLKKLLLLFTAVTALAQAQHKPAEVFGYVRSQFHSDITAGNSEFLVRMARLGVKGSVSPAAGYKFMVDFTRLGRLQTTTVDVNGTPVVTAASASFSDYLLDAEAYIKPAAGVTLSVGQFKVPFSTDNLRSGADIDFVNRPYTTNTAPALRDIGFMAAYAFADLPLELKGGLFNGSGQNKPQNDKSMNYSLRASAKPAEFISLSANYYGGRDKGGPLSYYNFGADVKTGSFAASAEYGSKITKAAQTAAAKALFLYSVYTIGINSALFTHIQPAVRYEYYDPSNLNGGDALYRITPGLSLQFAKVTMAQLRFNYEHINNKAAGSTDRFIAELQVRF